MPLLDPIPSLIEHADFAALEWEPLLALVAGFAASPVGRNAILDLRPSTDEEWITRQHQLTGEVRFLLPIKRRFPAQLSKPANCKPSPAWPTTSPPGKHCCNRPRRA